jgi:hypothetical protein
VVVAVLFLEQMGDRVVMPDSQQLLELLCLAAAVEEQEVKVMWEQVVVVQIQALEEAQQVPAAAAAV